MKNIDNNYVVKDYKWKASLIVGKGHVNLSLPIRKIITILKKIFVPSLQEKIIFNKCIC
jgi:hypothetical protein